MSEKQLILVRFGEIALKGQNRGKFERQLVDNLRGVLEGKFSAEVRRSQGRIFVYLNDNDNIANAINRVRRVFGVVSVSPARRVQLDDEAIAESAKSLARRAQKRYQDDGRHAPFTFKISARRANKEFHKTSPEINHWLGAEVLHNLSDIEVDVHEPDLNLQVEIRSNYAYLMGEVIDGPGGLPVGSSGTALSLLSGGIDSPAACWYMMKRGLRVEAIHFYTPPYTGPRSHEKVKELCGQLAKWGNGLTLHMYHFTKIQQHINKHCPERLILTVMRRMMLRASEKVAEMIHAPVLITGESLGQVASQTLENMQATEAAVECPLLRPLVGMDKEEIIKRAKYIGTYETSIQPYEDCCTLFVPQHPKTTPSLQEVANAEESLPIDELLSEHEIETVHFDSHGQKIDPGD